MGRDRPCRRRMLAKPGARRVPGPLRVLPRARPVAADQAAANTAVLPDAGVRSGHPAADQRGAVQHPHEADDPADRPGARGHDQEARQGRRGAPEPLQRRALRAVRGDELDDRAWRPLRARHAADLGRPAGRVHLVDGPEHQVLGLGDDGAPCDQPEHARALGPVQKLDLGEDVRARHLDPKTGAEPAVRALQARELAADRRSAPGAPGRQRRAAAGGARLEDRDSRRAERAKLHVVCRCGVQDARERAGVGIRRGLVPGRAGGHGLRGRHQRAGEATFAGPRRRQGVPELVQPAGHDPRDTRQVGIVLYRRVRPPSAAERAAEGQVRLHDQALPARRARGEGHHPPGVGEAPEREPRAPQAVGGADVGGLAGVPGRRIAAAFVRIAYDVAQQRGTPRPRPFHHAGVCRKRPGQQPPDPALEVPVEKPRTHASPT
mmetsp:Transcript_16247/g.48312  ORF Transcript_16247/g.48312 Transcript_16247/m.48312 type:complete len:435 (+) Transcript_16247:862-2166(+)